jgi:hypothetical protein
MRKLVLVCLLLTCAVATVAAQHRPPVAPPEIESEPGLANPPMVRSMEGLPVYRLTDDEIRPPLVVEQPDPPPLKDFAAGRVVLWCVVGTDGKAHSITIAKHATMDADIKAVENLKKWKFKPGKKKDADVPILMAQEVVWR